ncbi:MULTISPECIES: DNA-formamidopyrimidine glycosylase family protein [Microbacterium]|uniref:DNA-formamidopyrimidine glycosylase family protein n=1 Tax=Microbacterium TaxID=33882 RepID=UPI00278068D6|nr:MULTISPECIES: DNA-formamidopyrimidine glycosylase family protein [Microbacterium]MDQ1083773.1 formamidopyrimidine-DNA glycosylase [Microbacterium sp. SORGH_AS_0344]MDQ1170949.1 formamidopyrimidine-DNA glycosylase [Microbacterium proteolyticum]
MPEAPEVDALAGFLRERLIGHEVTDVDLVEGRALKTRGRPLDGLVGRAVTGVTRYGKHIDLDLDGVHLGIGFGRAGWATWDEDSAQTDGADGRGALPQAAVIARITLAHGILGLTDAGDWLSMQLHVVDAPEEVPSVAKLGPDAADPSYSREMLAAALGRRRKQLKALLQEQETLAGIGNAYSDEILFAARLSPTAHAAALSVDDITRLHHTLHDTLTSAVVARRDVPIAEQKAAKVAAMRVHGRTGEPCPECGGVIEDIPGTKGGGQWCPSCQTLPAGA